MRVLIVDDEPLALRRLTMALADVTDVELVGAAADGDEALEMIETLRPDLVFLDVEMPGRSGMSVAGGLAGEHRPEIVFVTAFEHYAPDAFGVDAADYVLKPVRLDRLRQALDRARLRREMRLAHRQSDIREPPAAEGSYDQCLWAPERDGMVRVPVEQIDWIEAARDYALLHTRSRSYILRTTMTALADRLDPAELTRVHRSAFVRFASVERVIQSPSGLVRLILSSGAEVQVGPSYTAEVRAKLKQLTA